VNAIFRPEDRITTVSIHQQRCFALRMRLMMKMCNCGGLMNQHRNGWLITLSRAGKYVVTMPVLIGL